MGFEDTLFFNSFALGLIKWHDAELEEVGVGIWVLVCGVRGRMGGGLQIHR